ncbi:pentatricopeptide repeat-containing protein [Dorcoceras hygrometricum]|uniref:Protein DETOXIFICATION n=1 Tax=Dorcoceras hygrometricum TaxID=472368 RepID=A0A2Z7CW86_9LAMI|nr:pentatricopeptide repeat-containing protein [Dorcoceras hygrometricum]
MAFRLPQNSGNIVLWGLLRNPRGIFKKDELGLEIAQIALLAALALAADPIASLVDTAFIGHIEEDALGSSRVEYQEIEIVETSIDLDIEQEELIPKTETSGGGQKKIYVSSASSALFVGGALGLTEAVFLICAAKPMLSYMGVRSVSIIGFSYVTSAIQYLILRSFGAPAVFLSLAMQGVFRGFKDTKTPLYATMIGDMANIVLDPIFIFLFKMGVSGAAIAHVISQYFISVVLLWRLTEKVHLVPLTIRDLQLSRFLQNGSLLLFRVIAATSCPTLAASMAAKLGSAPLAAFQICLQVWLATSLLADGLAVAGQAILANAFARKDYDKVTATASRVLQLGLVVGLFLCLVVAIILQFSSVFFTEDINVLRLLKLSIPMVVLTQPINSFAFVIDGLNYGASDFAYSAYSMANFSRDCECPMRVIPVLKPRICRNMVCVIYLHVFASAGWIITVNSQYIFQKEIKDWNKNRTMEFSFQFRSIH